MKLELRIAEEKDAHAWDNLIESSPQGSLFHQWKWLRITERHTSTKLYPLMGMHDNVPVAVLPLFCQKKGFIRMAYSPPPHASIFSLGPAFAGYNAFRQDEKEEVLLEFQRAFDTFIENTAGAGYVSISLSPDLADPRSFAWAGYTITPQYDYYTDLSPGPERLFQSLDKKQRQNLNRALKRGMTVEQGGRMELERILDMMTDRYQEQSKAVTESREYFMEIYDAFEKYLKIFVAKAEGEILSGVVDFHYRNTHFSWIGNPKPKKPISPSPNDLLIWETIRYACNHGCRYYVTMSAAGNRRLHSYYAAKSNPELRIRFLATKKTFIARMMEAGYSRIMKPLQAKKGFRS